MKHLLKTPWEKIAPGRNKSKHYFRPVFAYDRRLLLAVLPALKVSLRDQVPFEKLSQTGALAKTEVVTQPRKEPSISNFFTGALARIAVESPA